MSEPEDLVRAAMRAHEHEAPTLAEFGSRVDLPTPRPRVRWVPIAAATACVLAIAGVLVATHRDDTSPTVAGPTTAESTTPPPAPAKLSCPDSYPRPTAAAKYWVPQQAQGIDGGGRLVPVAEPSHVLVCEYLSRGEGSLTANRQLSGDLTIVPATLSWLPRALPAQPVLCAQYRISSDDDNYLLGLSYPAGTLWVDVRGDHCTGASNGRFTVRSNLVGYAEQAMKTGTWQVTGPETVNGCPEASSGRLGQDSALVPEGAIAVEVCKLVETDAAKTVVGPIITGARVQQLAAAFGALPSNALGFAASSCADNDAAHPPYLATFEYSFGPPVQVKIRPGCTPEIENGTLSAASATTVLPQLTALLH